MKELWRISSDYLCTEMDDEMVLLPVAGEKILEEKFYVADGVGKIILKMIQNEKKNEEIIVEILNHYDVSEDEAVHDMENFIQELFEKGIIEKC